MITFANPIFLEIGVGLTLLVALGLWSHARRRRRLATFFGGRRATARISRVDLYRMPFDRLVLLGLATLALSTAAAGPEWTVPEITEPELPLRRTFMLAIDVSASMQGTDVSPTRLGRASEIAREVLASAEGDAVGLLIFAGQAYTLAPPTFDHGAIRYFLDGLTPTIASAHDPGSLLSVGIRGAADLLDDEEPGAATERFILLLSDGGADEPESAVATAARQAASGGVVLHAIGIGTSAGSDIVLPAAPYQLGGRLLDESGAPVISRIRPRLLEVAAESSGGRYADAATPKAVADLLASVERPVSPPPPIQPLPSWQRVDPVVLLSAMALLLILLESLYQVRPPRPLTSLQRRAA